MAKPNAKGAGILLIVLTFTLLVIATYKHRHYKPVQVPSSGLRTGAEAAAYPGIYKGGC